MVRTAPDADGVLQDLLHVRMVEEQECQPPAIFRAAAAHAPPPAKVRTPSLQAF